MKMCKVGLIGGLALALLSAGVQAQDYPSRPITIIVPFPGGGTADLMPRVIQDSLAATLGTSIIIENRSGASGTTGATAVARAAPDGYTLLASVNPPISQNIFLQKNLPYDPQKSFAPISIIATTPLFMVVHPSLPVKTVAELVAYAKKNPGKLFFGSAGIGTGQHIVGELINKRAGVEMVHLPYRGTGPMMADLLSGQFQLGFSTPAGVLALAEAGKVNLIAVAEKKRYHAMPNMPTIAETIPGIDFESWYALFAPAGTPKAIIDKLHAASVIATKDPKVIAKFKETAVDVVGSTPQEVADLITSDLAKYKVDLPLIGLEPQ